MITRRMRTTAQTAALLAATLSAGADTPAVFRVTDQVINPNVEAFTATTGPRAILVDANFEPMVWRQRRFSVKREATGRVYADQLDFYDSFAPGFWDGAELRALRAANGRISERLRGRVRRFHHGAWTHAAGGLAAPTARSARYQFEPWSRGGQRWWLALSAVGRDGRESALSEPVEVIAPNVPGERRARIEDDFAGPAPAQSGNPAGAAPSGPRRLRAVVNPENAVISLSWESDGGDIAGFRLYRTYTDPAKHTGTWLELDATNGGDRFTFKVGDMILLTRRATTFSKEVFSPRLYNAMDANPPWWAPHVQTQPWGPGEYLSSWSLAPHPAKLPDGVEDAGETCLRVEAPAQGSVVIRRYNHADTTQNWYPVLDPAKTYVVEALARQEGLADPTLTFHLTGPLAQEVAPIPFTMTEQWQRFRATFRVPRRLEERGGVGQMGLQFRGPGVVWLDNFRVYDEEEGLTRHPPADRAEIRASGISAIRTHDTCKTDGYLVENLLGHPLLGLNSGGDVFSRGNLSALLKEFAELGVAPWLQIEFTLAESEWQALVEYLAAPYDPARDTPQSKPWAWRRVQHGQPRPYAEIFPRILIEFSNENWNPIMAFNLSGASMVDEATAQTYGAGDVYGMLQEYVIGVMKRSPHWTPEMERKTEFVIGGWAINRFGYEAARRSPSSRHVLIADYNGGWDAGEHPEEVGNLDAALLKTLNFAPQQSHPRAVALREERDRYAAQTGHRVEIGTYEAGPGYNLDGLNNVRMTPEMVEFESRVMKSLAAGTATLDCFLGYATQGAKLQNFFTFSRNRHYWTSHADFRNGGQAYPSWMALALFNRYATGDVLAVHAEQTPTRRAERVGRRPPLEHAPEAAVYATRRGDRLAVFALSRRLDGHVRLGIRLPIRSARQVTLHTLTGDPRAHNLDARVIEPRSRTLPAEVAKPQFVINEATGADARGLPPASVFLYVFEGVEWAPPGPAATIVPAPGQRSPASEMPVRFRVQFTHPPAAFGADKTALGGSAEPQGVEVRETSGSHGLEYDVRVAETLDEGDIELRTRGVQTRDGRPVADGVGTIRLQLPADAPLPLLAWNFYAIRGEPPESRVWDGPIAPSRRLPALEPTALAASRENLLSDNIHYNFDGAGAWTGAPLDGGEYYYSVRLAPVRGRALDIFRVEAGFWASGDLRVTLEVWRDGQKIGEASFKADRPLNTGGQLHGDSGVPAVADARAIPALQNLREPVELRFVFGGLEKGGVFGIGKLGLERDDLVVWGRLKR